MTPRMVALAFAEVASAIDGAIEMHGDAMNEDIAACAVDVLLDGCEDDTAAHFIIADSGAHGRVLLDAMALAYFESLVL